MSNRQYEEELNESLSKTFGGNEEEEDDIQELPEEEGDVQESFEEDPESDSHEVDEEEVEHEPLVRKGSEREEALKREFNRKKREAYRYQKSLEQAQDEIRRLASLAEENKKIGMYYYGSNIESDIHHVKKELEVAIDDNDAKRQAELQSRLAELTSQKLVVDNFKSQNEAQEQQARYYAQNFEAQQQYQYQKKAEELNNSFNEWVGYNEWANPESDSFDEELCDYVRLAGTKLDNELLSNNRGDLIGTPEYFQEMDNRVEVISNARDKGYFKKFNRNNLNMREAPNLVSRVRNGGGSSSGSGSNKIRLSAEEMDMAKSLGLKPQDYLKAKLQDMKDQPERYRRGN